MKKYILIVFSAILLAFFFIDERLDEKVLRNLMPSSNLDELTFECSKELYGYSFDGSIYKVYVYHVANEFIPNNNFPLYKNMFPGASLDYTKWKQTPFEEIDEKYIRVGMVDNNVLPRCIYDIQDKIIKKGNYYSCLSSFVTGNYLFIYLKEDKKLVVFYRKGG